MRVRGAQMKVMLLLVSLVLVSCTSKLKDFRADDEKPSAGSIQAPAEETSCYVTVYIKEKQKEVSETTTVSKIRSGVYHYHFQIFF